MLGERGMRIEAGSVNKTHAKEVIKILDKFDVIANLNNFRHVLSAKLGWQFTDLHKNKKKASHKAKPISAEDLKFIQTHTSMDQMVYEHFGGFQNKCET